MPACEVRLVGRVGKARLLADSVVDYIGARKSWQKVSKAKAKMHGVLLAEGGVAGDMAGGEPWEHVVGVAFFDVGEERNDAMDVWCLLVVRDMGLVLARNADGSFCRLGWVLIEKESWFLSQQEVEVPLR